VRRFYDEWDFSLGSGLRNEKNRVQRTRFLESNEEEWLGSGEPNKKRGPLVRIPDRPYIAVVNLNDLV
jgi:hypothetical protein